MINRTLAESYLLKAVKRLKVLRLLLQEEAYSDVGARRRNWWSWR